MGHFYIDLIHFSIVEGGVDFYMTENALDLFYRHSLSIAIVARVRRNL